MGSSATPERKAAIQKLEDDDDLSDNEQIQAIRLVNIPGNPRVNFSDPYPYPLKPGPLVNGSGFNRVSQV